MIDLAFTRRPLRAMWTSAPKRAAVCVSCADGRACSPSLLLMVKSREIIALCRPCALMLHRGRGHLHHALGAAGQGSTVTVEADGEDAEQAVEAIGQLIADGFGEE
jgi:hypothetical protein